MNTNSLILWAFNWDNNKDYLYFLPKKLFKYLNKFQNRRNIYVSSKKKLVDDLKYFVFV